MITSLVREVLPLILLCTVLTSATSQGTLFALRSNGPTANRINLVFLAEGYTNGQIGKFTNNANAVVQRMVGTQPYYEYSKYLNAFAIFVASAESGSDHPAAHTMRNTYFNSTFDSYGIARSVTIPPNDLDDDYANGQGKVDALLQTLLPDYDIAVVLVNDTQYGGTGGRTAVVSLNASSAEIALHELGHSFAHLGDEYTTPYPGYPEIEEPNTTRQTNRSSVKWSSWIAPATPLPTPDNGVYQGTIGLFEGAHYHDTGWYRPQHDCEMRTLGVDFCAVCRETIVKSLYDVISPIDSVAPATNLVTLITNAGAMTFALTLLRPSAHFLMVDWFVNDLPRLSGTNTALTLTAFGLLPGTNTVRAEVFDPTMTVRNDPLHLLRTSCSWRVRATLVPPTLGIQQGNDSVTLSWSAAALGFQLQYKANLNSGFSWSTLGLITNAAGASFHATNTHRYFRLRSP